MKPSRRDVCRVGLLGVASLGLGSACDASRPVGAPAEESFEGGGAPQGASGRRAYDLSLPHFAPHVGSSFRFVGEGAIPGTASLKLSAVDELGIAGRQSVSQAECFSLSFSSREGDALEQGTYTVSHDALGSFPLFVVPGSDGRGPTYTALVNRL